jgi:excisionase family DNA binding protein
VTASEEPLHLADRLALRPKEVARALGISERTVRQLLPRLPHVREGGVVLIPVEALREWLRQRAQADPGRIDDTVRAILAELER